MKLFRIEEVNESGNVIAYWGCFYAKDEKDAKRIASVHHKNKEIATTGFYEAAPTTEKKLAEEIKQHQAIIDRKTKILNAAKKHPTCIQTGGPCGFPCCHKCPLYKK